MKKIAIISLNGNFNFGNKLQNYAVQKYFQKKGYYVENIRNFPPLNNKKNVYINFLKFKIKSIFFKLFKNFDIESGLDINDPYERQKNFLEFNTYINNSEKIFSFLNLKHFKEFDIYVVGSDQIWNPIYGGLSDLDLVTFSSKKKYSISASFGIEKISEANKEKIRKYLKDFNGISVREETAKKIIEESTSRNDVEVLVDPTMLLNTEEWNLVCKKPINLPNSYILCYFLGNFDDSLKNKIKKYSDSKNFKIIDLTDMNDNFYSAGPSEFVYLISHAKCVFTDSFHAAVFSILYHIPFVSFGRKGKYNNMNSRLYTLLNKFNLSNQFYNDYDFDIESAIKIDFSKINSILDVERKRTDLFFSTIEGGE